MHCPAISCMVCSRFQLAAIRCCLNLQCQQMSGLREAELGLGQWPGKQPMWIEEGESTELECLESRLVTQAVNAIALYLADLQILQSFKHMPVYHSNSLTAKAWLLNCPCRAETAFVSALLYTSSPGLIRQRLLFKAAEVIAPCLAGLRFSTVTVTCLVSLRCLRSI